MACPEGLEPPTCCLEGSCSIQLSYGQSVPKDSMRHPRLRARHVDFHIDAAARDAWLGAMRAALDDVELAPEADRVLWDYLVTAADMLVNADD